MSGVEATDNTSRAPGRGAPRPLKLTKEQRLELVRQAQHHFRDQYDLELGDLAAGFAVDFFAALLAPLAYNEAIEDARAVAAARADTLQEELLGLTRQR